MTVTDSKQTECPTCRGYGQKEVAIRDTRTGEWREDVVWCDSCHGHGYLLGPGPTAARSEAREGPSCDSTGRDGSDHARERQQPQSGPEAVPGGTG